MDIEKYAFAGTLDSNIRLKIKELLKYKQITSEYNFNGINSYYYIYDHSILRISKGTLTAQQIEKDLKICSATEFLEKLESSINWWKDLHKGSIVTIAKRIGQEYHYPYSFVDNMACYAGRSFKIKEVYKDYIRNDSLYKGYKYFNGDMAAYELEGVSFTWHSSMFVPTNQTPTKKIDLCEISFLDKIL